MIETAILCDVAVERQVEITGPDAFKFIFSSQLNGEDYDLDSDGDGLPNAFEEVVDLNFDDKRMTQDTLKNVMEYHSTPQDVGKLAQAANVKRLVLNHFVPPVFDEQSLRKEISKYYDGEIILGKDLDVFNL